MAHALPLHAKVVGGALRAQPARRPASEPATRASQPERRPLGRLFGRGAPSTFHRCLAVHMHFATRASALD